MNNENLQQLLDDVEDEKSFVAFLRALGRNRDEENRIEKITPSSQWAAGALGWENGSIEAFLEASSAWASDSDGGTVGGYEVPSNPWKRCADILFMGKIYE